MTMDGMMTVMEANEHTIPHDDDDDDDNARRSKMRLGRCASAEDAAMADGAYRRIHTSVHIHI